MDIISYIWDNLNESIGNFIINMSIVSNNIGRTI